MATHNDFGKEAEDLAVSFLKRANYEILLRNYRYLKAEIDIIAKAEGQIIVVEVKARSNDIFMEPQKAIDKKKMALLALAANHFLEENNINLQVRFDIITIISNSKKVPQINHIKDAFECIGQLKV